MFLREVFYDKEFFDYTKDIFFKDISDIVAKAFKNKTPITKDQKNKSDSLVKKLEKRLWKKLEKNQR